MTYVPVGYYMQLGPACSMVISGVSYYPSGTDSWIIDWYLMGSLMDMDMIGGYSSCWDWSTVSMV